MKRPLPPLVIQYLASPPARGRGLKLVYDAATVAYDRSPPARGRGLKRAPDARRPEPIGRPPRGGVD